MNRDSATTTADATLARLIRSMGSSDDAPGLTAEVVEQFVRDFQQQRLAHRQYQSLLHHSLDAIFTADCQGRFTSVNPAAERISGYTQRELLEMSFMQICAPDCLEKTTRHFHLSMQGQSADIETAMLHKDGHRVELFVTGGPLMEDGQVTGVFSIARDITERRQIEHAILNKQRLIDAIFDSILASVAYLDRDFNFVRVNATYAEKSCHSMEELIGRNHFVFFPDAGNQAIFERVRDTGEPFIAHARPFVFTDQPERGVTYWDWWLNPIRGSDGQVQGLVLSLVDVTSAERGRREVERLNDELKHASAAKDQFLAVLSHELRTPLTPVLTTAQMMERDPSLSPEQRESMTTIRRNVELEARLIDDLLDLTRITRGKLELNFVAVDVHEMTRHVVKMMEHEAAARQVALNVDAQATQHHVQADAARLQQVLWNLLRNAIKFTPPGGRVAVRLHNPSPDRIAITVQDSGIGIAPDMLPRIFDAFEQGGRQITRRFGGLGLGLAISRGLVDMQGGTLTAQSDGQDKGATFTLGFGISSAPGPVAPQTASEPDRPAKSKGTHVLLVEDHADSARTMRLLLRSYGFEVQVADCVDAALRASQARRFDLIISDIGLPDGSGLDLMRQLSDANHVKGIALSGYGMDEDIRRSLEAGFAAHVTKPVNIKKLEETIRQVLND